jgi:polyphosphate kinase
MRTVFNDLIAQEIERQRAYGDGRIIAKMNALDDTGVIQELYRASQAGVRIDLIVRGHCRLRPQLPGYSENIRVVSILGRFLEHERIFYFGNHGDPLILIGSADWRGRNLNERVELVIPVEDAALKTRLYEILRLCMGDNTLAWDLDMHGAYTRRTPGEEQSARNVHKILMRRAVARSLLPPETIATALSPSPT